MKTPAMKGFVTGAVVGLLLIAFFVIRSVDSTNLLLLLWPTSIVGFGYNGGNPVLGFVIGSIEILGQMVIYGGLGALIGQVVSMATHRK
ncbi:hypothetical protein [Edaphobacter flagellatus]|uniref:hypothetical protein n=1 Tax=Edaphobacter flagellatus TaxID=1933044 RepID=UPI0021B3E6EC|nr:hypothetical protein [Edaphobacter flagellatus]